MTTPRPIDTPSNTVTPVPIQLAGPTVMPTEGVNVYDVLYRRNLVMTRSAVEALTQRLAG